MRIVLLYNWKNIHTHVCAYRVSEESVRERKREREKEREREREGVTTTTPTIPYR